MLKCIISNTGRSEVQGISHCYTASKHTSLFTGLSRVTPQYYKRNFKITVQSRNRHAYLIRYIGHITVYYKLPTSGLENVHFQSIHQTAKILLTHVN